MDSAPRVSVVIPTRGRSLRLARTLEGIIGQDYAGSISCLVVFDQELAADPGIRTPTQRRVHILTNTRSPGPAGARNTAALAVEDDVVAFCDDDDVWEPSKLRRQIALLAREPKLSSVTSGVVLETARTRRIVVPPMDVISFEDLCRSRIAAAHMSTLVTRRETFHRVGPFDEGIPGSYAEDYDWLLRAARMGPVGVVRKPLVRVAKGDSWFDDRYETIALAVQYLLAKHPCLRSNSRNAARMLGRIAFANAALGRRRDAVTWAARSLRADWREPRALMALAVAARLCRPGALVRAAQRAGKGI